jgi:hypothetical protein
MSFSQTSFEKWMSTQRGNVNKLNLEKPKLKQLLITDRYLAPDIAIIKQQILNGEFVMSAIKYDS